MKFLCTGLYATRPASMRGENEVRASRSNTWTPPGPGDPPGPRCAHQSTRGAPSSEAGSSTGGGGGLAVPFPGATPPAEEAAHEAASSGKTTSSTPSSGRAPALKGDQLIKVLVMRPSSSIGGGHKNQDRAALMAPRHLFFRKASLLAPL